ncbi:hypothetical protein L1D55_25390 [Vibrio sp. Isolate22]|nr:hypothetical protein [Vibrio sp. Isolate22]
MAYKLEVQQEVLDAITAIANPSWWDSPAAIVIWSGLMTALGAGITYFVNQKLEDRKMQSEVALRKVDLDNARKESVLVDQKAALKELSTLSHNVRPTVWTSPDYDAHQAYSDVVLSMFGFLNKLDDYLRNNRYLLSQEVIETLEDVMFICNQCHWNTSLDLDHDVTETEIESAKSVLEKMSKAEEKLRKQLNIT